MNTTVIIIEMIVFAVLFTVLVFSAYSGGRQYSAAGIHNYPPEIQEEYFKTHERMEVSYKSGKVIATKGFGMTLFTAIIAGCAYFAGAKTFLQGFLLAFFLMAWIGVYDTFFLDWVLFANLKMFRLEGTEHMDKEYHQKWFHVKGMLFPGVVFALIPAALVGFITMTLF